MATLSRTQSGNNFTYTVTDVLGNSTTILQTNTPGYQPTLTFGGGALLTDGQQLLAQLLLPLSTGLSPVPNPQNTGLM